MGDMRRNVLTKFIEICTAANKPSILHDVKYFCDFSHFDSDSFLSDVEAIDFCEFLINMHLRVD